MNVMEVGLWCLKVSTQCCCCSSWCTHLECGCVMVFCVSMCGCGAWLKSPATIMSGVCSCCVMRLVLSAWWCVVDCGLYMLLMVMGAVFGKAKVRCCIRPSKWL